MSWTKYRSGKAVYARQIVELDHFTDHLRIGFGLDETIVLPPEWGEKHHPQVGGYIIRANDGFCLFSPSEAFDLNYTRMGPEVAKPKTVDIEAGGITTPQEFLASMRRIKKWMQGETPGEATERAELISNEEIRILARAESAARAEQASSDKMIEDLESLPVPQTVELKHEPDFLGALTCPLCHYNPREHSEGVETQWQTVKRTWPATAEIDPVAKVVVDCKECGTEVMSREFQPEDLLTRATARADGKAWILADD